LDAAHRGAGAGRSLLEHVEAAARAQGLTKVVCETQAQNVPAIGFYRACGYAVEGIDLSYYSNDDDNHGEVALFVKKSVVP
jgi:ribosomal protein S18 acetylase RimI-like enzyme